MTLGGYLGVGLGFRLALVVGLAVALAAALLVTPKAMRRLQGAGITGRDRHKPGAPEIPEMGGLAVFLAFDMGVFTVLALGGLDVGRQPLVLAALIVAAGACITGVLDDLVSLRQRFKAFIPMAFALPLSLFVDNYVVNVPLVGGIDFGLLYPLVLVPLAVTCASNGFNMLEGFNGLGAGLGIVMAAAITLLAVLHGNLLGVVLLLPLIGALGGFLWFNYYPAKVFPGDTMTLLVGAVLASAAILSKVEFWAALLFVPHVVEFFLKAGSHFEAQSFASEVEPDGTLRYHGPIRSLTHVLMTRMRLSEPKLSATVWAAEAALAAVVLAAAAGPRLL